MALRTFRSNPSLGGFGGESTVLQIARHDQRDTTKSHYNAGQNGCDAFAQIIKELVDNAVDACRVQTTNRDDNGTRRHQNKRVQVVLERFEPTVRTVPGTTGNRNEGDGSDDDDDDEILKVTVTDNGCGMENIQDCVEAFRSSKSGGGGNIPQPPRDGNGEPQQRETDQCLTAGRYGIGLTLCLLHAQRLVANSSAIITSATASMDNFEQRHCVVDVHGDAVRCVKSKTITKRHPAESGTSVCLLVPGGRMARLAWPRLAEYFGRFNLSLELPCSMQVMASNLTSHQLFVRALAERNRTMMMCQLAAEEDDVGAAEENEPEITADAKSCKSNTEALWWDGFGDDIIMSPEVAAEATKEQESDVESDWGDGFDDFDQQGPYPHHPGPEGTNAVVVNPVECRSEQQAKAKRKPKQSQQADPDLLKDICRTVELYLDHAINIKNIAYSKQPIRIHLYDKNKSRKESKKQLNEGPHIQLTMVVDDQPDEDVPRDVDPENGEDVHDNDNHPQANNSRPSASLLMVRMVNGIPLLDGAEATSCGLVQGVLRRNKIWNSFGLEVSGSGSTTFSSRRRGIETVQPLANHSEALGLPSFHVRDSDQVAPFFQRSNHSLFEMNDPDHHDDDSEDDGNDDVDGFVFGGRKRRKRKRQNRLLPAHVRLGKILVIVQIDAEPSSLPLPTLSKGRLPTDNPAIDKALELALSACLHGMQRSNPSLFLTAQQLKKTERDARYVPAVAASLASIVVKSRNAPFRSCMTKMISAWQNFHVVNHSNKYNLETGTIDLQDGVSDDEEEKYSSGHGDEHSGDDEGDVPLRRAERTRTLERSIGENLERRLRQALATHEEASRSKPRGKSKKIKKNTEESHLEEEEEETPVAREESHHDDSDDIQSVDFSEESSRQASDETDSNRRMVIKNASDSRSFDDEEHNCWNPLSSQQTSDDDSCEDASTERERADESSITDFSTTRTSNDSEECCI